ncbi:FKBP-type peptidyl-prolyl cis-trans isomerase [Thiomicrorhabdus sediminis]|uniref:Peptidyl-prolyl cis-trans isomerase n=1 Tax=Thiomicrorhabdus sediminis TaxID=2580412 RepID=A0A4P9K507_9GAMM|nr:peptidylprolyl isomerase [Thiomicrorhabdus sediminis]QCU90075.1 peptidylprolyl isomerase [Thiomicrorhabdus sediminis]
MSIQKDKVALIEYVLTDETGEQIDASNGNPLAYLHGHNNLIPGLESELEGKNVSDKFKATIAAADAYGDRVDALVQTVPSSMFQGVDNLEVGMRFEAQSEQGMHSVEITAIDGDQVTVDGNHPLAGMDLTFDVEVIGLRDATEDELAHGHAHGDGGVQH